jgi:hypothetical protein
MGGGQGTDSTLIKKEIESLDPDKYIGTIGLQADRPTGAVKPHYTSFPDSPEEGNWLRVVSETTIDSKALLIDQKWMCITAKTEKDAAIWELVQRGNQNPLFPPTDICVGAMRRYLNTNTNSNVSVLHNNVTFPPFTIPGVSGVFDNPKTKNSPASLTDISDLDFERLYLDFYINIYFSSDSSGVRTGHLNLYSYYPENNNRFSILLDTFTIYSNQSGPNSSLLLYRPRVKIIPPEPIDDNQLTHVVGLTVQQNSGTTLNLTFVEWRIIAYSGPEYV